MTLMNGLLYALAMLIFVVTLLAFVLGQLRPSLFKFLGTKATRRHIAVFAVSLLIASIAMGRAVEPANIKQARMERENKTKTTEQQKNAEKIQEQETITPEEIKIEQQSNNNRTHYLQPPPENTQSSASLTTPASGFSNSRIFAQTPDNTVIKKNRNNICREPGSEGYMRTVSYTAYKTLKACLNSGGRLPKS